MPQSYEVKREFVAVHPSGDRAFEAVRLQRGAMITVDAEHTSLRSGLVKVLFEDTVLAAYLRDIEDWTERVGLDEGREDKRSEKKGQQEGDQDVIASGNHGARNPAERRAAPKRRRTTIPS